MAKKTRQGPFLLCVKNEEYAASLEVRKIYQSLEDGVAAANKLVRVIDESGEDYLYPDSYFLPIDLPPNARRVFVHRA